MHGIKKHRSYIDKGSANGLEVPTMQYAAPLQIAQAQSLFIVQNADKN